jgi:hypothetical protein
MGKLTGIRLQVATGIILQFGANRVQLLLLLILIPANLLAGTHNVQLGHAVTITADVPNPINTLTVNGALNTGNYNLSVSGSITGNAT